jgi:hypothetical protein
MFEYKVVAVDNAAEAEKVMNQYAKEGWRVISNTFWSSFLVKLIITFEREK